MSFLLLTLIIMGKGKKGGKRMNKAQLTEMLQEFFANQPGVKAQLQRDIPRAPSYHSSTEDARYRHHGRDGLG